MNPATAQKCLGRAASKGVIGKLYGKDHLAERRFAPGDANAAFSEADG